MAEPAKKGVGILALMGSPDEGDGMGEKEMALRDFFSAGKRGDWSAAAASFQEAYDLCAAHAGDEDEEVAEDEDELYGED